MEDTLLWNLVVQLTPEARESVTQYYLLRGFPIRVRETCAEFIEVHWLERYVGFTEAEVAENNQFIAGLLELVRQGANEAGDNETSRSLELDAENIQGRSPQDVCIALKDCLDNELRVVTEGNYPDQPWRILWMLKTVSLKVLLVRRDYTKLDAILNTELPTNHGQQAILQNQWRDYEVGSQEHNNLQNHLAFLERNLNYLRRLLLGIGLGIAARCQRLCEALEECFQEIYSSYLKRLKWDLNGSPIEDIPQVAAWMEKLLEFVNWAVPTFWNVLNLSLIITDNEMREIFQNVGVAMPGFQDQLRNLRRKVLENVFAVSQQGPRVYRQCNIFRNGQAGGIKVKILAGSSLFAGTQIQAIVLNEAQAMRLIEDNPDPEAVIFGNDPFNSAIGNGAAQGLVSNLAIFNRVAGNSDEVEAIFRNLVIPRNGGIMRSYAPPRALHERFCLLFRSRITFDGEELVNWCCSAPFAYLVHTTNQRLQGEATMFWDELFRLSMRKPFQVADEVPLDVLLSALNVYFNKISNTSRYFTAENLDVLREKITSQVGVHGDNQLVLMNTFCRSEWTPRNGVRMTFWDWFYYAAVLVRDRLRQHWNDGYIVGFIKKEVAENILRRFPPGILLVRFPASELRALSYAVHQPDGNVVHWEAVPDGALNLFPFAHNTISIMERGHATKICHTNAKDEYVDSSIEATFRTHAAPMAPQRNHFAYVVGNPARIAFAMMQQVRQGLVGPLAFGGLNDADQFQLARRLRIQDENHPFQRMDNDQEFHDDE